MLMLSIRRRSFDTPAINGLTKERVDSRDDWRRCEGTATGDSLIDGATTLIVRVCVCVVM